MKGFYPSNAEKDNLTLWCKQTSFFMKKIAPFLLLFCSLSFLASTQNETINVSDDDDEVIEIDVNYIPPVTGPKRAPAYIPINATYYVASSIIEVTFLFDIGNVDILITDLSNGSSSTFNTSSMAPFYIPKNLTYGIYSIEFITSTGCTYIGYLSI